ncbi:hypothetical protein OAG68_02185 [bacterium]|nr:hypothetical protein [bacterium]
MIEEVRRALKQPSHDEGLVGEFWKEMGCFDEDESSEPEQERFRDWTHISTAKVIAKQFCAYEDSLDRARVEQGMLVNIAYDDSMMSNMYQAAAFSGTVCEIGLDDCGCEFILLEHGVICSFEPSGNTPIAQSTIKPGCKVLVHGFNGTKQGRNAVFLNCELKLDT